MRNRRAGGGGTRSLGVPFHWQVCLGLSDLIPPGTIALVMRYPGVPKFGGVPNHCDSGRETCQRSSSQGRRPSEDFCQNMFYPSGPRNELFGCRGLPLRVTYIIFLYLSSRGQPHPKYKANSESHCRLGTRSPIVNVRARVTS